MGGLRGVEDLMGGVCGSVEKAYAPYILARMSA